MGQATKRAAVVDNSITFLLFSVAQLHVNHVKFLVFIQLQKLG